MKIIKITIILVIIISIMSFFYINRSKIAEFFRGATAPQLYESEVVATKGALIKLLNGEIVQLAGIYIPLDGTNYKKELLDNVERLLKGKKVKIKTIAYAKKDYPAYPLVIIYDIEGTNINERLLNEGKAFFDHGYYSGKEKFYELEKEARSKKKGIWGEDTSLEVLFIGSKKWEGIHLKDCPKVKNISMPDRIEYYFIPEQIYWYRFMDMDCSYGKQHKPSAKDFADYYYRWNKEKYLH